MSDAEGDPLAPPNTYVYDGARARQGWRLNKLAMSLVEPANRETLRADEDGYMARFALTAAESDLVRRRDWSGMLVAGGNVYLMYKLAGALGISLPEMGAQMRGETLAEMRARMGGRQHTEGQTRGDR
jgi:protocatechuate 4,5-dioxygenase alpha subunit